MTATGSVDTVGASDFGVVSTRATCPRKTKLVGGGFATDADSDGGIIPIESRAIGKRVWLVAGVESGEGERTLDAYAYCRKGGPGLKQRSATVAVPSADDDVGPETAATPTCPKKTKAVAGGFAQPPPSGQVPPAVTMSSTRSAKRTWTVSGQIAPGGRDATLTGYAYCSRKERTETSASEEILIRQLGSVESPACPTGTSLSGGFRAPPLSGQSFVVTFASYRAGDKWVTRAIQGGNAGSVTTLAYCG